MLEVPDQGNFGSDAVPSARRGVRMGEPTSAEIAAALVPLHAATDQQSLADAIEALAGPLEEEAAVCAFLDDGSGTLVPFVRGERKFPDVASIQLDISQPGPLAQVYGTGELVVLESLKDLVGEQVPDLPARRILLLPLQWEEERLGIVIFFDQGGTNVELFPRLAEHIALALVRLRALDQHFRFGGIDPSHWLFDREWLRLRVEEEVDRALRYGHPLTLLLFLFENLDEITRNVGRHQTEVFLRRVAAVIRGQIRSPDVLAGYGKASIAVLMPETERPAGVAAQSRVAARLSKMRLVSGVDSPTPVLLLAAASCPEDARTAADLVDVAESRLARHDESAQLEATA
jgi:diguanylate cyclase (GGDEF)-like protein